MAARNTASSDTRQRVQRSNTDSVRWIVGLLLLCVGFFAAVAVFSSFFCWETDQSVLRQTSEEAEFSRETVRNWCGAAGARLGILLVDNSVGIFGILVPVIIMLIGVRIIRQRPLLVNHSILALCLIILLGSLTLGFATGPRWSFCCSTGWGGAFGIGVAELLRGHIGSIGAFILLAVCWILVGVFINRNFINTVNSAGQAVVDRGERFVGSFRQKVASAGPDDAPFFEPQAEVPVHEFRPVQTPEPVQPKEPWYSEPQETSYAIPPQAEAPAWSEPAPAPVPAPQPVYSGRAASAPEDDDPFTEIVRNAPEPVEVPEEPAGPVLVAGDDEFLEFDLSRNNRVVMGRGGLVELDRPAMPEPVVSGPFTEITMAPEGQPAPAPQPVEEPHAPGEPYLVSVPAARTARAASAPQPSQSETAAPEGVVVTVETNRAELVDERSIPTDSYDPLKDLIHYRKPSVSLLEDYVSDSEVSSEEIFENKSRIEETLKYFGIPIQRIKATVGPTVTLYEIVQAQGVKISKIQGLENDIAQSLKALGIRIIAPIPGKGTIGIEVPNRDKQVVSMYSAVRSVRFQESKAELPVVIGRTIQNENYVFDLAKMPHLLVAGATGQGKSVGLNAIITSLLYRKHPAQLKFVMIDPKMVEFSLYAKLERHFLAKMESEEKAIITDPMKAVYTLNSLCLEMDNRLELCSQAGARNIVEYNEKFTARRLNPEKGHRYMPYIVVVVDEFADLIMMAREVERPVMRLAQKARAVGIHLIIATQRPDVKVITGGIKANFPARIAFRVMQMIDSRTIIDQPGANQLIGRGDMLFSKDGELTRIQCALVETREVERIVDYIAGQQGYTAPYTLPDYVPEGGDGGMGSEEASAPVKYDVLFAGIARSAVESGSISTSMIQRNYEVGFNRASRIMTQLEKAGIVGRQIGDKPREILLHDLPSLETRLQELGIF